jgi:hypothetical protein
LNFVFDGSDGDTYVGTAGHCVFGTGRVPLDQERRWEGHSGPPVFDSGGKLIGNFAYARLDDLPSTFETGADFALIRLRDGVKARAAMCFFGGPTGTNSDRSSGAALLHFFGNGIGLGNVHAVDQPTLPARSAIALSMSSRHVVDAFGAATPGDSGSGVISDDGRAVGVVVTGGFNSSIADDGDRREAGTMGITRLGPQLQRASSVLGIELRLRTAPLRG